MTKKLEVGVVGLGKFGFALGEALAELGHDVVGVDSDAGKVRSAREALAQVYEADGTDKKTLEQLGFQDFDCVAVSVGRSMEASILAAMNLKELGVKQVWAKALSSDHEKVLVRLGVDFVVFPEQFVARQLAHRLAVPGLLDYLGLGSGVLVREVEVDEWTGKTLAELKLPMEHKVQVVAIKRTDAEQFNFVPDATLPLGKGDILVVLGDSEDVSGMVG